MKAINSAKSFLAMALVAATITPSMQATNEGGGYPKSRSRTPLSNRQRKARAKTKRAKKARRANR